MTFFNMPRRPSGSERRFYSGGKVMAIVVCCVCRFSKERQEGARTKTGPVGNVWLARRGPARMDKWIKRTGPTQICALPSRRRHFGRGRGLGSAWHGCDATALLCPSLRLGGSGSRCRRGRGNKAQPLPDFRVKLRQRLLAFFPKLAGILSAFAGPFAVVA